MFGNSLVVALSRRRAPLSLYSPSSSPASSKSFSCPLPVRCARGHSGVGGDASGEWTSYQFSGRSAAGEPLTPATASTGSELHKMAPRAHLALDARKKRLARMCMQRGMRENDLLLGAFARKHLDALSAAHVDEFENFLDECGDPELNAWLCEREPWPEYHTTKHARVVELLRAHMRSDGGPLAGVQLEGMV